MPKRLTSNPHVDQRGVFTSEFLLTVVALIGVHVALVVGTVDGEQYLTGLGLVVGPYALSRGLAKKGR